VVTVVVAGFIMVALMMVGNGRRDLLVTTVLMRGGWQWRWLCRVCGAVMLVAVAEKADGFLWEAVV
jgi:hypothetical protein